MSDTHEVALWTRVLDAYDESLDRSVAALEGTAPISGDRSLQFTPPAALPPMPESLRSRAVALAERTDAVIARVATAAAEARPARAGTHHRRLRSHAPAVTFDRRG